MQGAPPWRHSTRCAPTALRAETRTADMGAESSIEHLMLELNWIVQKGTLHRHFFKPFQTSQNETRLIMASACLVKTLTNTCRCKIVTSDQRLFNPVSVVDSFGRCNGWWVELVGAVGRSVASVGGSVALEVRSVRVSEPCNLSLDRRGPDRFRVKVTWT